MHAPALALLPAMSRFVAQAFVAGLWQGLLLVASVAICLRLLPRVSAAVRFAVWSIAFAALVAVPLLNRELAEPADAVRAAAAGVRVSMAWSYGIAGLWAMLMCIRGAGLVRGVLHLRRISCGAQAVSPGPHLRALLQRGSRPVELCTSPDVDSPGVIGFFQPRLLIPDWLFLKLSPAELHQVVIHECEHLRRRDDWSNLLQKIGLVLFPLNPALLWIDGRLTLEREIACDAGVVASTAAPFDYAASLTRLAEHRLQHRTVGLLLAAWGAQSQLARRVHRLLRPVGGMSPVQSRCTLALLSLGLAASVFGMARAPRLVTFADVLPPPASQASATVPRLPDLSATGVTYQSGQQLTGKQVTGQQSTAQQGTRQQGTATLANAIIPSVQPHRPSVAAQPAALTVTRPAAPARLRNVGQVRRPRQPRMVLTTAVQPRPSSRSRAPIYALPAIFSPSYAAVPFGNGWLIFQL